ncbi:MAG TPA: DUF2279 domain-containing protein, partial [Hanamia sp.]|nr:DUF2279 domain-containing protein [Hanamia sp.]
MNYFQYSKTEPSYFCQMFLSANKQISVFLILVFFGFITPQKTFSQDTFKADISFNKSVYNFSNRYQTTDTFRIYPYNKKRISLVTIANIVGYGGTLVGLNAIWYAKYPRSGFHFFNDDAEWQQMDKVGHVYSAYTESRASVEAWRWAGLSRKKSIWIGGLSGVAYQSIIEILDGFSSQYGFSPGDFTANIIGSAAFISQELSWNEQKIQLKFSFHRKNYGEPDLDKRADVLYGKTEIERFIKDYNGQSYWASANIQSFFPETKLPRWLNISIGYGA